MPCRRVCFDESAVVSFDPAHSPSNASSKPLPRLYLGASPTFGQSSRGSSSNSDVLPTSWLNYAPLEFRPAGLLEGSMWVHNYAECFMRLPSRIWRLQRDGAMSDRTQPVGERVPDFAQALLQPFTPQKVVSFAEFSQRLAPEEQRERCFELAYLCVFAQAYRKGNLFGAAQAVLESQVLESQLKKRVEDLPRTSMRAATWEALPQGQRRPGSPAGTPPSGAATWAAALPFALKRCC
ncbi:hypothetical protein ABPG75_008482 [Micractinium tetrahymenae]